MTFYLVVLARRVFLPQARLMAAGLFSRLRRVSGLGPHCGNVYWAVLLLLRTECYRVVLELPISELACFAPSKTFARYLLRYIQA